MLYFKKLLLVVILFGLSSLNAQNPITVIHAGTVLDIPGSSPKTQQTIVIEKGKIIDMRGGYLQPAQLGMNNPDVTIIDLKDKFLMPGFIDMHTHITGERDPGSNPHDWTTTEEADAAFDAIPYAKRTLDAGFTTVRNLGGDAHIMNALKRAIAKKLIAGPRILASNGAVSATGGHGDFHGYRDAIMEMVGQDVSICDGSDDCRRAVRALVKSGADVIKITATGGVLSNTAAGVGQQLTDDEMKSIVAAAASLGRKVAAHAHEAEGVNAALRAGVNSIEHGSYLNDESIRLFQQTGAYLVPTLLAGVSVYEELSVNPNIPPAIIEKIKQVAPVVEASFKKALAGKINIAFGTDSGVSKHGTNAREFELMVTYGMDENQAIKTATINAAELLGMTSSLGTLEKGKFADIVAVDGNPLENISELKNITFVMKEGDVYKE
ncbi:Xaa-Pro dipeptidase [Patiriisocius marinistellae]|uniref:Xaa-Pro dipeptidase n=1 Tax=Patiriisocius marinistellae TaxID=2494560 RepID=A0A5J4G346_9FLAO|nr:amidohydrolase family protein [Patiriisocius marinistellae]GEQ87135.1 Xaa-Pro dipeptidase [Patiriisocius marinistellae]